MIPQLNRLRTEDVRRVCQVYFRVTKEEMLCKSRKRRVARPRQFAMALSRDLCVRADNPGLPLSLPRIGSLYGGLDHTTVLHAVRRIAWFRENRPNHQGHDYEVLRLALLTYKAQNQLPEVDGYAQEAMDPMVWSMTVTIPNLHGNFPQSVAVSVTR